jgi:SnoaL-like domain
MIAYLRGVSDTSTDVARRWIEAYRDSRDDDLIELAHPEIVLRPRRGQGAREYLGFDGVRDWLADVGGSRPKLSLTAVKALADGRAVAETKLDGVEVIAVFEIRDDRISAVSVYLSNWDMLEWLGVIGAASA